MPDTAIDTTALNKPHKIQQNCGFTVWTDYETLKDIDLIAAYEHMDRGPLVRLECTSMIRRYKRNPAYKRFLVDLKRAQEEKKGEKE